MTRSSTATRTLHSSLVGQRLIECGYLSQSQLKQALISQHETALLLGEVCLLNQWITYDQLQECLPDLRSKIGGRLLAAGLISMRQLWLALLEQRRSGQRLGDILLLQAAIDKTTLDLVGRGYACL